jgi:FkbM family methyltransferase
MNLTNRLKSIINGLAGRFGYRMERIVDYGEDGLDVFQILIEQLGPDRPDFFFVQVGANDGRTNDPIYKHVAQHHWRGLLLEPLPHVFAVLTENYRNEPQLILENVALSETDGTQSLWSVEGAEVLASFDRAALAARTSKIIEVPVQTATVKTLVQRHGIDHIDLMVIDTEGYDYQVIKMTLADGVPRPRLIRYEHLHLSSADRKACAALLVSHGYRLLRDGIDTIAYRTPAS